MPSYSPPFAPHVEGSYPEIRHDPETGEVEPFTVKLRCGACGARDARPCASGRPREKVVAFSLGHAKCAGKIPAS